MYSYKLYLLINFLPNPISNNGSESHGRRKSYRRCSLMCSICQCKSPDFLPGLVRGDSHLQNVKTISSTISNQSRGFPGNFFYVLFQFYRMSPEGCLLGNLKPASCNYLTRFVVTFCNKAGTSTPALIRV